MNTIRAHIYKLIPKRWRKKLGKSKVLRPIREVFFRNSEGYREYEVSVDRMYNGYPVNFKFVSSIQIAVKAQERGVENTLLRHSIELLKKYKPRTAEDYVVADVGANFGFLSLVWSQSIAQRGKIFAFEPHPQIARSFGKSIEKNKLQARVNIENMAVGRSRGHVQLALGTTTSNTEKRWVVEKQLRAMATIEMVSLDEYFEDTPRLDLLKIDVDGIELDILHGASHILRRLRPVVIVESNNNDAILAFLRGLDYLLLDMELQPFEEGELPPNVFCVPK